MNPLNLGNQVLTRVRVLRTCLSAVCACALVSLAGAAASSPHQQPDANAPVVTKVEPPSWWLKLTPELMVLVYGHHLDATRVACNLKSLIVERTESSASGDYLFVWLEIGADAEPGTAVCHVTTPEGATEFELPLSSRSARLGRNQGISAGDVIYLIMPDRFADGDPSNDEPASARGTHDRSNPRAYHGGDLEGIRDHLPYLKDLGVTTLWLTPIVKNGSAQDYHGYGAVDLYAVDPHLGTVQDYRELVAQAHKAGMKVAFDFVANHVGPKNPWVDNPPLPDWFHGTAQRHLDSGSGPSGVFYGHPGGHAATNDPFELLVDPHSTARLQRNLTDGWFVNTLPDLNTENPAVAQYLLQNAIWWAESSGLDAYRLDTFPYVSRKFWSEWHAGLRQLYPFLTTIGEVFHPDPSVVSFFAGGVKQSDGIDSGVSILFDYPMYFALRDVLLGNAPTGKITDVLRSDWMYPHPDELVTFFGNHDVPRFASAEGSSPAKLELAYGLALTLRGIPELYYGDEIGMRGGADPDNRHEFPGGWPGDPQDAFTQAGRTSEQQQIFAYVSKLLHLRHDHTALQNGKLWHLFSDESSYVFLRETEEERVVVAFNNADHLRQLSIPLQQTPAQKTSALSPLFGPGKADVFGGKLLLALPPQSLTIFQAE